MAITNLSDSLPSLPENTRVIIVSHDVDWSRKGPGVSHVLARRDRFDPDVVERVTKEGFNPYYGVPRVAEIEEQLNIRSTFFFRPVYDDGSYVDEYKDTMRELVRNGWEVGLHVNDPSSVEKLNSEKERVEKAAASSVYGSRIHYLRVADDTFANLAGAGFKYDSSLSYSKETIDPRNTNCLIRNGLYIFPITFMDAYLFTYMRLTEETLPKFMFNTIEKLFASTARIVTLLWHDNSIMMKGGRIYANMMKQIASIPKIEFLKGIEAFELVQNLTKAH